MISAISMIWIIFFFIYSIYLYNRHDKEYKTKFNYKYSSVIPAKRTPAELDFLMNATITPRCVGASIMDLVRKKVLLIEKQKKNIIIRHNLNHGKNLTRSELFLIQWLMRRLGHKNQASLEGIKTEYKRNRNFFYRSYKEWVNRAIIEGLNQSFFEKKEAISHTAYSLIGLGTVLIIYNLIISNSLILISALFFSVIVFSAYIHSFTKKTYEANEEYVRWMAFKRNLRSCKGFDSDCEIQQLEEYAVYAYTLKELKAYKNLLKDNCKDKINLIEGSNLLKLILNGDMIKLNRKIEKYIRRSLILETAFDN